MPLSKTFKSAPQLSVFLVNKPGVLAQICQRLAADKVHICGMSMMDATEHGVLRLVVDDTQRARDSLAVIGVPTSMTNVLLSPLPNRPDALADVVERLAEAHITVHYAYLSTAERGGKTLGIFKVSNLNRAVQVLSERTPRRRQSAARARSDGRVRRR
jgi:hypothetical protein